MTVSVAKKSLATIARNVIEGTGLDHIPFIEANIKRMENKVNAELNASMLLEITKDYLPPHKWGVNGNVADKNLQYVVLFADKDGNAGLKEHGKALKSAFENAGITLSDLKRGWITIQDPQGEVSVGFSVAEKIKRELHAHFKGPGAEYNSLIL